MFFRTAWLVLRKDVAIEAKSWEVLTTTLFFAVSCVLIFAFAFVKDGRAVEDAAAGILWIAIASRARWRSGRTFERERYGETLRALLLAPAPRAALYVGKLLGMLALLGVAELLLVPLVALLFQARRCSADRCCWSGCWRAARSGSARSARCSPRCWCAPARATCCCRSCCIPSSFL